MSPSNELEEDGWVLPYLPPGVGFGVQKIIGEVYEILSKTPLSYDALRETINAKLISNGIIPEKKDSLDEDKYYDYLANYHWIILDNLPIEKWRGLKQDYAVIDGTQEFMTIDQLADRNSYQLFEEYAFNAFEKEFPLNKMISTKQLPNGELTDCVNLANLEDFAKFVTKYMKSKLPFDDRRKAEVVNRLIHDYLGTYTMPVLTSCEKLITIDVE